MVTDYEEGGAIKWQGWGWGGHVKRGGGRQNFSHAEGGRQ